MDMSNSTNRDELTRELFENMNTLKRSMHQHMHTAAQDSALPRAQLELLFSIHHLEPVSFKELAKQQQLTPGAVSQLAEPLEQQGYIARHTDEADRRMQFLTVTPTGFAIIEKMQKQRAEVMSQVMAELSDEELAVWLKVQRTLLRHFQTDKQ